MQTKLRTKKFKVMKLKTFQNKIDKYNEMLRNAIKEMDNCNEFYSVGCTCISCDNVLGEIFYTNVDDLNTITITDETDGQTIIAKVDGKELEDDCEIDWLLDGISEYKKMIRKTLRIWRSDNPDKEAEKEDEED